MHVHSDCQRQICLYFHIVLTKATDAVGDGKSPINFVFVELLLDIGNHHVITTLSYL